MVLIAVLFLTFWIRIQGVDRIPDEQFTGVDPYLYRWQALTVSDKGYLPARDMHRWYPLGRDNGQLLSLFSYVIAYTHKAVGWIFPKLTLYDIQLYAPHVCWTLGLCVLLLFLTRSYGVFFAASVGVLLAHYRVVLRGVLLVLVIGTLFAGCLLFEHNQLPMERANEPR